jgi:hypothetical protein
MKLPILIIVSVVLSGCSPYTRYGQEARHPKIVAQTGPPAVPFNDYLRLGMIIRDKLGIPYVGSSQFRRGTDCSNLTQEVFGEFGGVRLGRTSEEQFTNGVAVPRNRMRFGDLVFFSLKKSRISHVGIYVGYGEFVHASEKYGVIRSRLNDKYWADSFVGARRVLVPRPN